MIIRLASVKNIRDFSEYGCAAYIRSAHLNRLKPADGETLVKKYHLRTVIDLRTSQEVKEKPDMKIPGVTYLHIPLFDGPVPGVTHESKTDRLMQNIPDMASLYRLLVTEEAHLRQIEKVMKVISDPDREGTVLWHCTEGKDRCGIISALFLLSRGVPRETVMKDYLKTNRVNFAKAWGFYALLLLVKRDRAAAVKVRDAFLARREYLEPVLGRLGRMAAAPAAAEN